MVVAGAPRSSRAERNDLDAESGQEPSRLRRGIRGAVAIRFQVTPTGQSTFPKLQWAETRIGDYSQGTNRSIRDCGGLS